MHKALLLAASISFIGVVAANAQSSSTPQTPSNPPAAAPSAAPKIQRINVVDVSELPQATQKQVEQVVAQGTDDSLKQLRSNIDAVPEAKAALKAKGSTSAQVVATSMGQDGTLTLITKKNS
ncbi:hypothetical protein ACFWXH_18435 [Mesorhizobium sp. NPDC059054]|uniref:hypothetical protein n=1 Tax=unclassified Mesorhizobium TaxID=325217 RepID=UPI0006C749AB|nr:hypothetical protein [Mesorhizobium sp. 1M-11]